LEEVAIIQIGVATSINCNFAKEKCTNLATKRMHDACNKDNTHLAKCAHNISIVRS